MKVSYIIITWKRAAILEQTLQDIRSNHLGKEGVDYEIVIHNEEADGQTREVVERYAPELPIVYGEAKERLNSCGARNACIGRASGDLFVFIDDDVRLPPDFIQDVLRYGHKFPAFSCRIDNVRTQPATGFKGWLERHWTGKILRPLGYFVGGFSQSIDQAAPVEHLPGCMMVFRREIIGDIRFDVRIGAGNGYLDDADFSHTIKRERGIDLTYVPHFSITHLQTQSGGNRVHDHGQWYQWYWQHKWIFFKKHLASCWTPLWLLSGLIETLVRSIVWRENMFPVFIRALYRHGF